MRARQHLGRPLVTGCLQDMIDCHHDPRHTCLLQQLIFFSIQQHRFGFYYCLGVVAFLQQALGEQRPGFDGEVWLAQRHPQVKRPSQRGQRLFRAPCPEQGHSPSIQDMTQQWQVARLFYPVISLLQEIQRGIIVFEIGQCGREVKQIDVDPGLVARFAIDGQGLPEHLARAGIVANVVLHDTDIAQHSSLARAITDGPGDVK